MNLPTSVLEVPYTYRPPAGYYDLPCHWVYDGSVLTNGINAYNQAVFISRGYGEFLLRRICGLSYCLGAKHGQYQIKNGRALDYMQSLPVYCPSFPSDDSPMPIEERYPEAGAIRFDLLNPSKQVPSPQIVFMGVGRHKGVNPLETQFGNVPYRPVTQNYTVTATIASYASGGVATPTVSAIAKVTDYDFDLLKIELNYTNPGGNAFNNCVAGLTLFDGARQQTSNLPIFDCFWNSSWTGGVFNKTAVVPSLFYPQNSNLRLDLTPLAIGALGNVIITISFVGRSRIPL